MSIISRPTRSQYPYPGLRPFKREEADIFFGRDKQIDQLLEKLSRARFLAVVGPSGCGKSSLVRAGMMAALETGFMEGVGARWRTAEMRPGSRPMARLAKALMAKSALGAARVSEDPKPEKNLEERAFVEAVLRRGPLGLVEVLRETPLDKPRTPPEQRTNLLILVDQFEEIFRYREQSGVDEAEAFVALLLATKEQREFPIYVVITMRSDFLGHCARFPGLPEAINESEFLTPRMEREERTEAIVGPAELFDGEVEPALVNRLLNDSGSDPNQLPLLQHVLMRIWTRAGGAARAAESSGEVPRGPVITFKDYEEAGGLAKALSNDADEAYNELNEAQKRIAEVMFKALCERSAGGPDVRRLVRVDAVAAVAGVSPEEVKAVVEVFRAPGRSFLMPELDVELKPETVLDISHESLISHWARLKKWVKEEAEAAEQYRRLEETASRWKKGRAGLWDTPDLELALKWKEEQKASAAISSTSEAERLLGKWAERYGKEFTLAMEFLDRSEAKQKERIAERLEKERRLKRTRRWAIAASLIATGLAAVGWSMFIHANNMRQQADKAREQSDELILFMVFNLRDKLRPLGQLQLMLDVTEKVFEYYDEFEDKDKTKQTWEEAVALQTRGDVLFEAGNASEALDAQAESLDIFRKLAERAPSDSDSARSVSLQCERIATLKWAQADLHSAVGLFDEAVKTAKRALPDKDPNPILISNLAYSRSRYADAIKCQGKLGEALALYHESLEDRKRLADGKDSEEDGNAELFGSYIHLGDAVKASGNLPGALEYFEKALAIAEKLKESSSRDVNRLHNLSQSYDRVGEAFQASGKLDKASDAFIKSNEIFERLWANDPDNANWGRNYSVTWLRLMQIIELRGGFTEAGEHYNKIVGILHGIAGIDDTNADLQDVLSEAHMKVGDHLLSHGDLKGALENYQTAFDLRSKTATKDFTNHDRQELFAEAHEKLGTVARARGELDRALDHHTKSSEIRKKLAEQDVINTDRQANLALAHEHLGDLFKDRGDAAVAREAYKQALTIRKKLAEKDASNAQWQDDLAVAYRKLGETLASEKNFTEASSHLENSLQISSKLVDLAPGNARWQVHFADCETARAEVFLLQGDHQGALELLRAALQRREAQTKPDPTNVERQSEYAHALRLTATAILQEPESKAEARDMIKKGRELMRDFKDKVEFTREQLQWLEEIEKADNASQYGAAPDELSFYPTLSLRGSAEN